jgi:electron transport complex protein RnfD
MPELYLGTSPHIGTNASTRKIMLQVLIGLAPAAVYGVVLYGLPALLVILTSVAAAVIAEALFRLAIRQSSRSGDLSAAVTGLLLALVLPPATPLWMAALGAAFAVIVAKEFFGGLGANVFNPALSGRAFLLMSFPAAITTWTVPRASGAAFSGADAVTGATPLGALKMGIDAVSGASLHFWVNFSGVEKNMGVSSYGEMLKTLFMGNRAGCIGESSIFLILVAFVYLLAMKIIDWRAPLAMVLSVFVFSTIVGSDPVFSVLSGGLLFGAVFMATDYTTAPVTAKGKVIFGIGAGIVTVLIRKFGNYPEGTSYGILIMNAVTPFLNRLLQKKYGYVKPVKGAAK